MRLEAEATSAEAPTTAGTTSQPSTPESTPSGNETSFVDPTGADEAVDTVGDEGPATDWEALSRTDDEDEAAAPPAPPDTGAKPVAAPPSPAPATGEQPQVAQTTQAPLSGAEQPPAAVAQPPSPTPEAGVQAPQVQRPEIQQDTKSQADLEAEAQARTQAYTKSLEDFYKLPEEMATQFEAEPAVALPQLAAKLHMAVEHSLMARLSQELPQYIATYQRVQERESAAKTAFYDANPDLKGYEPQVLQAGEIFRKLNPNATPEQAIQGIGLLVRTSMGVQPTTMSPSGGTAALGQQVAPPAPQQRPRQGFVPAMPGGAGFSRPPESGNIFEQLAEEFIADDLGG